MMSHRPKELRAGREHQRRDPASSSNRCLLLFALLFLATTLCAGSSKRGGGGGLLAGSGPFRSERDKGLNHPALLLLNETDEAAKVLLKGPMEVTLVVPPRGAFRTLVAAGTYRFALICRAERCPFQMVRGKVRFIQKRRYRLRIRKN